ncbi:MAG: hypothetical protein ACFE9S_17785 [Candidatus Hermodarchaeota archaeon]
MFKEISQDQIYEELLKIKTDEELHEMPEDELTDLIIFLLPRIKKKPMKKEVKMIYI